MTSKITALSKQMSTKVAVVVAVVAAKALLPINTAIADEAFVCGDGSVVNVKSGDLEIVKRTNPCVARYFGLDVSTNSSETAKAIALGATALLRGDGNTALPLPSRNPHRPDLAQSAGAADAVASAAKNANHKAHQSDRDGLNASRCSLCSMIRRPITATCGY